jgi:small subunit ribosomal protein S8
MAMTDPIADLLTRIRNAQIAGHDAVRLPASHIKETILKILQEEGFIVSFDRLPRKPQDELEVRLKYLPGRAGERKGAITGINRESKPGRRVYVGVDDIPRVRQGLGVAIVSTSKGVLPDHLARKERVGGELLLTVW